MGDIRITSGPAEVIAAGTVIEFSGNPVEINFGPPEERLTIVLDFIDIEDETESAIRAHLSEPYILELTLLNFKNPVGSGTSKPLPAGTLSGRNLYIHLRVYELLNSDKTIHYCIYLGEEVGENEK